MYAKILVAVDGSDNSIQALKHATELARGLSATLRILHVVDMDWLSLAPELAIDVQAAGIGRRLAGKATLAAARATSQAAGLEPEVKLLAPRPSMSQRPLPGKPRTDRPTW